MFAARNMMFARASGFDPLSLSPALWLSDTGSDPSVWNDLSGNGRHATQATAANQPAIVAGALNGRQVRRFDGIDDLLSISSKLGLASNPSMSVAMALKSSAGTISRAFQIGGSESGSWACSTINAGNNQASHSFAERFNNGNKIYNNSSSSAFAIGVFTRTASSTYADGLFYRNGALQTATTITNPTNALNITTESSFVGAGQAQSVFEYLEGDIAELLVFPTALSTTDRQQVENYLNAKWAIY